MLLPSRITQEIAALLQQCTEARGFLSNVGSDVRIGAYSGDYTEAPALFIVPGRQSAEPRYANHKVVRREYELRAFVSVNDHATLQDYEVIDLVILDVRQCLQKPWAALREIVEQVIYVGDQPGYRESGGVIVGASIQVAVVYDIDLTLPETT